MLNDLYERKIYTVSELTHEIKDILEANFEGVWVTGEISGVKTPMSGHIYFTLKDEGGQLKSVLYRGRLAHLKFQPEDGIEVVVMGTISVYEPRGEYQLIVDHLEPKGLGALQLAFEQLKKKLTAEGLFDPAHKKPIPAFPKIIGVVTSPTGAAIRDILKVLRRRFANVEVLIYPVRVQGETASQEIAKAIQDLNTLDGIDVLIVGRGGGSIEDLWAFNEEIVARSIYASRIPVISAVGHEIDFTIADLVADLRAPTPSAAAEMVVKNKADLVEKLDSLSIRLKNSVRKKLQLMKSQAVKIFRGFRDPRQRLNERQQRIDDLEHALILNFQHTMKHHQNKISFLNRSLTMRNPLDQIRQYVHQIKELRTRLVRSYSYHLEIRRSGLEKLSGKLDALSPLAILQRGYAVCRKFPGLIPIKEVDQVQVNEKVIVQLSKGNIICIVEEKNHEI
jgi:exodeoxyribonuclease VII large subunit